MYKIYKLLLLTLLISNFCYAQFGLHPQILKYDDSTKVKNYLKWKNLKEWHTNIQTDLSFKYFNKKFDSNRYQPSRVMPKNFYEIDYRGSSYYVPRMVKDELNLIMNRPKDNSMIPILGVAFIAAQLASKYIFLEDKIKISKENVINTINEYDILKMLWLNNPQTTTELYRKPGLQTRSMVELTNDVYKLIDNKLIKQKNVEDQEIQFFPAITKLEYSQLLMQIEADTTIESSIRNKIQSIISK